MKLVRCNSSNGNLGWHSPRFESFSDYIDGFYGTGNNRNDFYRSSPPANIIELSDEFRIELAAPGSVKKDFIIKVENNLLNVSREVENKTEESAEKYSSKEFNYKSFKRTFSISRNIDTEKISAEYKNGILYIQLPKLDEAKDKPMREIKIG